MADQPKVLPQAGALPLVLTPEVMALISHMAAEMRKPYVDEQLVERKEKQRQDMRRQREEAESAIKASQAACNHLREDGTDRVAWQTLYHAAPQRYIKSGFCQGCQKAFAPGVPGYEEALRVPDRTAGRY